MGHLLHPTLSAKLNGEVLKCTWFTQEDLMNGATLELEMGAYPNKLRAQIPMQQLLHP
jgi:putative alpha-1,2-mannosidase